MKIKIFSGHHIYIAKNQNQNIDILSILKEFHENRDKFQYTHYINKRWENIYVSPTHVPSTLPLLSYIMSLSIKLFRDKLKPHQTLIIPHDLLGYEKNQFWFNMTSKGESTRMHNHTNKAVLSGVYYLQVPKNSGNIIFKCSQNKELEIISETNSIILFPPILDHYVTINKSNEKRISFSFNLYKFPIVSSIAKGLPI